MKKVVIHLVNSNSYSGLENVACDIIKNCSNEFEQIYVTQNGPIIENLIEKNIKFEIISKMTIKELKRVVKKYNVDIIHAHDFTASCIASLSLLNISVISHLHHNAPWLKKFNLKTILYLFCSIKFKKILTVSDAIETEYIFSKFMRKKMQTIGNPISVDKIKSMVDDKDYKKKYDICCVGRLTEAKNPIRWLSIVNEVKKEIPNIKTIWVGDGELRDIVELKIKELNLEDTVELVGFQKNPYKYLAASKVFLLTSNWEGFGLSAFEALSLGVPAIVSNVGGLPDIVDNECGYLCDDDSIFIKKIKYYLNKYKLDNNIKEKCLNKSNKLQNLNSYISTIKKIYMKG